MNWAAIFDWDGVIVDSSAYHEKSWEVLAEQERRTLPPGHFKRGFGMKNEMIIPHVLQWAHETAEIERLARMKEKIYRDLVRTGGIAPMDGVVEWLDALRASGIPCAIASSTQRLNIDCVMEQIRLENCFQAVVSGDQVARGKPDPEIFLLAARRLGVPTERCVVFEDAHVGIEAARAAGMRVIAVTTTNPREALSDADLVVDRLDKLTINMINAWFP